MIAAMSPVQNGHPISPGVVSPRLLAGVDMADGDLTQADLLQLFGEIDELQLAGLFVPVSPVRNG